MPLIASQQKSRRPILEGILAVTALAALATLCAVIVRGSRAEHASLSEPTTELANSPVNVAVVPGDRTYSPRRESAESTPAEPEFHTFSICAIDPAAAQCGVAVTTRVTQVGRYVPWVRGGIGAVATQATTATKYGPAGLDLLAAGKSPAEAVEALLADDDRREHRQLGIIDMQGRTAAFTGSENGTWAGSRQGKNYTVQGNLLVGKAVIDAVADSFESTEGTDMALADRLIAALEAGQATGGDKRQGRPQSAALVVAGVEQGINGGDITETLQVAEHPEPVGELRRQFNAIHERLGHRTFSVIRGRDVIELKRMLHRLKFLWPERTEFPTRVEQPDLADFDAETAAAVDRFRQEHDLPVPEDGLGHPPGLVDADFVAALRTAYNTEVKGRSTEPADDTQPAATSEK